MPSIRPSQKLENAAGFAERAGATPGRGKPAARTSQFRKLRRRVCDLVETRQAKESVHSLFDSPEFMPSVVAALWYAQVELFKQQMANKEIEDPEAQHRILGHIIANGRGIAALGIAGASMQAGGTLNITIALGGDDPGDGDELTIG